MVQLAEHEGLGKVHSISPAKGQIMAPVVHVAKTQALGILWDTYTYEKEKTDSVVNQQSWPIFQAKYLQEIT